MPRIDEVRQLPRKRGLSLVRLEDGTEVEMGADALSRFGLQAGDIVSPEKWADILSTDQSERCREAAWRLLQHRPRSREELRRALRQRRFTSSVVDALLDDLAGRGFVNDGAYAKQFAEEARGKRLGPRLVKNRLRSRGIDAETADEAAEPLTDPEYQEEQARRLLERWNRRSQPKDPRRRCQSAAAWLMRRGFDGDLVWRLVREIIHAPEDEPL